MESHCGVDEGIVSCEAIHGFACVGQQPIAYAGTEDTYAGTGKHIGEPVAVVVYAQYTYSSGYGVGSHRNPGRVVAILDAHQLGSHEGGGCVARGEGVVGRAVGAGFAHSVFDSIDHSAQSNVSCSQLQRAVHIVVLGLGTEEAKSIY